MPAEGLRRGLGGIMRFVRSAGRAVVESVEDSLAGRREVRTVEELGRKLNRR